MSQRSSKLYNLINSPILYKFFQYLMSGTSFRKKIIKKNISNKKIKVLDIGCGPAEILNYIPKAIYHGYDIDSRSIAYAKKKYRSKNHHFYCKHFNKSDLSKLPKFDFIILFGVLHHLSNKEIKNILNLCKKKMTKKSKLLTEDPILIKDQNLIANFLIKKDRGLNVRYKNDYKNLMKPHFKNINSKITHQFFIPYTWFSMICRK
jgi:2-polyprenyl-3-methyl-5-hydroxy-6-metoxy-1,4-benzoquinol methylase